MDKIEPRLKAHYQNHVRAKLQEEFAFANPHQVPTLDKIVLNVGIGEASKDQKLLESVLDYWERWSTEAVIEALGKIAHKSAKERLWLLMSKVVEERLSAHDPAIRAWALYDKQAARAVRR